MKQRKWTAEEKLAIVLEGLKEKRSVVDICREHKISQTLYYRWRDKFLESGHLSRELCLFIKFFYENLLQFI